MCLSCVDYAFVYMHWYALSPECASKCHWNPLSHWFYWYGFSSVCVIMWCLRMPFMVKPLSHWLHLYGFSSECDIVYSQYESSYAGQDLSSVKKSFLTLSALIWFLPSVSYHVLSKTSLLWKWFLTMGALIWFFPCMSHHMIIKITL